MKIGIVCSSGGAVFVAARQLLNAAGIDVEFCVVTDRSCGAGDYCREVGVPLGEFHTPNRQEFCARAYDWLARENAVSAVVMFYSRMIAPPLLGGIPCFNVHPSLLPAFAGLYAVKNAQRHHARFLGATLHLATVEMDAGGIIAQAVAPLKSTDSYDDLCRLSFAMKLYVFLVFIELWGGGDIHMMPDYTAFTLSDVDQAPLPYANPSLKSGRIRALLSEFLSSEKINWGID